MDEIFKQEGTDTDPSKPNLTELAVSIDLKNNSQNLTGASLKVDADMTTFLLELFNSSPRVCLLNDPFMVPDMSAPPGCLRQAIEVHTYTIYSYIFIYIFFSSFLICLFYIFIAN